MPQRAIIASTEALEAFCAQLKGQPFITVDTEFIRERTYFPKLCLVQVCGADDARAIDPLADGISLSPLLALLAKPDVLKVFHACRQDMEIFFHLSGTLPAPVFDTQVAAQFAGFGESVSYSELIRKMLGLTIDKGSRFTDWARRPLSDRQIIYALDDVRHLHKAYQRLRERLEKESRMHWVEEEMTTLIDVATYKPDPETAWQRIKAGNLKPKNLAVLRAIAGWREQEAMRIDIPRSRVVRDEALAEIAAGIPRSVEELHHIRGLGHLNPNASQAILRQVEAALASPPEGWPQAAPRNRVSVAEDALSLLQMLLAVQCRRHNILPRLVATREEMEAMIMGEKNIRPLHDWRREIFGAQALRLLEGNLRLGYNPESHQATLEQE